MRWLRGIAALATMLVVIGGTPVVLLTWGLPGAGWWRAQDGSLLLSILIVAGWVAWVVFTATTTAEVLRHLGGNRFAVNLPLLGGLQALCAGLVLAVVGLVAASGSAPSAVAKPPVASSSQAVAPPDASTRPLVDEVTTVATDPIVAPDAQAASPPAPERCYLVEPGDDLWSIAERVLGDGRRWRELARCNPETLGDPTQPLAVGARLSLPAEAALPLAAAISQSSPLPDAVEGASVERADAAGDSEPPQAADAALLDGAGVAQPLAATVRHSARQRDAAERITVERGDTLSELAQEHLGRAALWPKIAAANPDRIKNPDHIEVGWKLALPERPHELAQHASKPADHPAVVSNAVPDSVIHDPAVPDSVPADVAPDAGPGVQPDAVAPDLAGPGTVAPPITSNPGSPPSEAGVAPAPDVAEPMPPQAEVSAEGESSPDLALLGTVSVFAAAGLAGGWQARRLLQHRVREPGRRLVQPGPDLARFQAALGRRQQGGANTLDAVLRAIGRHHHRTDTPLPALAQVIVEPELLRFQWAEPAGAPPAGFGGDTTTWTFDLTANALAEQPWHPCPYPALVSLGQTPAGETVLVDLERPGVLGVAAEERELMLASLASLALELGCAAWADELRLVVVGGDQGLTRAATAESVTWLPDAASALALLRRRHSDRSGALAGAELRRLRVDPDRAESVAAIVFVFQDPLPHGDRAEIDELLSGNRLGISAVLPAEAGSPADWELFGDPLSPSGRLPEGESLVAHAVPESVRSAVASLFEVADSAATEPAPWWSDELDNVRHLPAREPVEEPLEIVNLRRLTPPHPTLMLIGPVDLTGAAGPEPERARQQLIELCSWLVEHPGRTGSQMAAGLGIAESTRRSNLSRLRSWLGNRPDGEQYLPDAYSGRIQLLPEVTSDVQRLRLLTGPGVNRVSEQSLVSALDLIRGDLFADAVPGQWFWADELRSDVSSTLRDAGLVLSGHAISRGDLDLARWAIRRALVVAPEDELLACARIRVEHAAGDRAAVERQVLRLSQQARVLGVDLMPETVMLCQQVLEGRARARRA